MKKLSRRRFLGATAGAAVGIGSLPASAVSMAQAPAAGGQPATIQPDTTLVLTNGRIHTMDARNTIARTVSIRNGRFVAVGDANPARGPNTRVIDLKGRTVVPGLIEAHIHIVSLANRPGYHTILENTTSIREIQEALAARRSDVPQGAWITSMGGWHPNQWAEHRHPTRQGARRRGSRSAGAALRTIHRPVRDQQSRQGILRRRRCRAAGASGYQAGESV